MCVNFFLDSEKEVQPVWPEGLGRKTHSRCQKSHHFNRKNHTTVAKNHTISREKITQPLLKFPKMTLPQPIWDFSYFALSHRASRNVFLAKKQIFSKNANFVLDFKEAKLSPSWMVLTAEIWEHNETFCYYFLMFWQKFSLCPQISAVSTIQQDSIWLLWNTKQRGHFLKIFVFCQKNIPWSSMG